VEAADLGGLEIFHGYQQLFQVVLLAPHHDGTKQGRKCNRGIASPTFTEIFWTHSQTVAIGKSERQVPKASHCDRKEQ